MIVRPLDLDRIRTTIRESSLETPIYVGCDSQCYVEDEVPMVVYVTAVVIHKDGYKGCSIVWGCETDRDYGSRPLRLMNEVYKATEVAQEIWDDVGDRPFQLHLDINKNPAHLSSGVMSQAIGYVRGILGIDPVLKSDDPHADYPVAASSVADRFATRKAIWR